MLVSSIVLDWRTHPEVASSETQCSQQGRRAHRQRRIRPGKASPAAIPSSTAQLTDAFKTRFASLQFTLLSNQIYNVNSIHGITVAHLRDAVKQTVPVSLLWPLRCLIYMRTCVKHSTHLEAIGIRASNGTNDRHSGILRRDTSAISDAAGSVLYIRSESCLIRKSILTSQPWAKR